MRTLIVEDDFVSAKVLQSHLSPFGACERASSGSEAITALQTAVAANQRYDLILLDIMIPDLNGHEVLNYLRREEEIGKVPTKETAKVIMVSALDDKDNVLSAFRNGCEAYLPKPIDRQKLLATVRKLGLIE